MAPADFPRLDEVALDIRVLGFTAIVVLATAALFAVVPALQASRVAMLDALGIRAGPPTGSSRAAADAQPARVRSDCAGARAARGRRPDDSQLRSRARERARRRSDQVC